MTTYAPHYYTGTGAQTDFNVSFLYLQKSQVKVTLDGTPTTAFTWLSASSIRFTSAPANGVRIKIYRDSASGVVAWADGATILGRDLNLAYKIARYLSEEAVAENLDTLGLDTSRTKWDAESKKFVNVPEPTEAGDVVTKNYADTGMASQLAAAVAAKTAAETAQAAATASQSAAASSATSASTSANDAATSATAAAGSASTAASNVAAAVASAAASAAAQVTAATTQATAAAASATTATTQAGLAAAARTGAETAEANAEAAVAAAEAAQALAEAAKAGAEVAAASAASSVVAAASAYDQFDDRFLGSKTSDPSVDNDGNALPVGAMYFNSVINKMKAWTGAAWALQYNDTVAASAVPNDSSAAGATVADALSNLATSVSGKAATSHTHAISDTTGLQTALDGKAAASHTHAQSDITNLVSDLAGKAAASHTHAQSDITGLTTALAGKAASSHTHAISDTAGLQTALDGKASSSHAHAISDTTGLQTALDAKAPLASPAITGSPTVNGNAVVHAGNVSTYAAAISESGEFSVPGTSGTVSWTHGLGSRPKAFGAKARCLTAEDNYAVGDEVELGNWSDYSNGAAQGITANATTVKYHRAGLAPWITVPNGISGGTTELTPGNWRIVFWAIK